MKLFNWFKKSEEIESPEASEPKYPIYKLKSFDFDGTDIRFEFYEQGREEIFSASTNNNDDEYCIFELNVSGDLLMLNIDRFGNGRKGYLVREIEFDNTFNSFDIEKSIYEFKISKNDNKKLLSIEQFNKIKSCAKDNIDIKKEIESYLKANQCMPSKLKLTLPRNSKTKEKIILLIGYSGYELIVPVNNERQIELIPPYEMVHNKIGIFDERIDSIVDAVRDEIELEKRSQLNKSIDNIIDKL